MPIKPENAKRYPPDWQQIRERILARAGNCCEGTPRFPDCRVPNGAWRWDAGCAEHPSGHWSMDEDEAVALSTNGKVTKIVLTVAHLDHVPEHCDDSNLLALCQRCHLAYDQVHHQQNAHATRRGRKAVGDLFD